MMHSNNNDEQRTKEVKTWNFMEIQPKSSKRVEVQ